jgi:hypothetical protein
MKYKKGDKVWYYHTDKPMRVNILAITEDSDGIWYEINETVWDTVNIVTTAECLYDDKQALINAIASDIDVMQHWIDKIKEGE